MEPPRVDGAGLGRAEEGLADGEAGVERDDAQEHERPLGVGHARAVEELGHVPPAAARLNNGRRKQRCRTHQPQATTKKKVLSSKRARFLAMSSSSAVFGGGARDRARFRYAWPVVHTSKCTRKALMRWTRCGGVVRRIALGVSESVW